MSPAIAFLVTPAEAHNDNHQRLPRLFRQCGWRVDVVSHNDLHWRDRQLYCAHLPAHRYTLLWPVGMGPRETFLDRWELLSRAGPQRCINNPAAYLSMHGKSAWSEYAPATHIASDAETLADALTAGATWVLKPLAGSFGRQVHKVSSVTQLREVIAQSPPQYWVLQEYIPAIRSGETRTLVCAGHIIGSYLRIPSNGWHANLATGASAQRTTLSEQDHALVADVQHKLRQSGVRFAAIDTVGGYVMEVNIANPGGLATLSDLYGDAPVEQRMRAAIETLAR